MKFLVKCDPSKTNVNRDEVKAVKNLFGKSPIVEKMHVGHVKSYSNTNIRNVIQRRFETEKRVNEILMEEPLKINISKFKIQNNSVGFTPEMRQSGSLPRIIYEREEDDSKTSPRFDLSQIKEKGAHNRNKSIEFKNDSFSSTAHSPVNLKKRLNARYMKPIHHMSLPAIPCHIQNFEPANEDKTFGTRKKSTTLKSKNHEVNNQALKSQFAPSGFHTKRGKANTLDEKVNQILDKVRARNFELDQEIKYLETLK
mmetsp:Transcript_7621/g.8609  ORF Transcript_7621/g.8609 Transcript_7621/m.8609 type:complete len:255 (-) Transcript_7621:598-1362(-)